LGGRQILVGDHFLNIQQQLDSVFGSADTQDEIGALVTAHCRRILNVVRIDIHNFRHSVDNDSGVCTMGPNHDDAILTTGIGMRHTEAHPQVDYRDYRPAKVDHSPYIGGSLRDRCYRNHSDDLTDRTVSHGFLGSGWYRAHQRLLFRGSISYRSEDVTTGARLIGDETYTRHRLSARYQLPDWGRLTLSWLSRSREHPDIGSEVDYQAVTLTTSARREPLGHVDITYTYYLGKFENRSEEIGYEFSDHLISGSVHPNGWRGLSPWFGGSYYRSRRDQDLEKFSLDFGLDYNINQDYALAVEYNVFNFDDYLAQGGYYTGNIVQVSIRRSFSINE